MKRRREKTAAGMALKKATERIREVRAFMEHVEREMKAGRPITEEDRKKGLRVTWELQEITVPARELGHEVEKALAVANRIYGLNN